MRIKEVVNESNSMVVTVRPTDTIADAVDLLKEHSIGAVVVSGDGEAVDGIMSERDVVRHLAAEQEGTLRLRVEELMTHSVTTCSRDDDANAVMAVMTEGRFRHAPILDHQGRLAGIVSLGDLVKARLVELESQSNSAMGGEG